MGGASQWKLAAKKFAWSCVSSCSSNNASSPTLISCSGTSTTAENEGKNEDTAPKVVTDKNLCAICLEPLNRYVRTSSNKDNYKNENSDKSSYNDTGGNNKDKNKEGNNKDKIKEENNSKEDRCNTSNNTIFTAECMHVFHLLCIASNVRHGGITCPICRSHWTQLPRLSSNNIDPVLRILDDSITTLRINRQAILGSTLYNDDDPIDPQAIAAEPSHQPRLHFALIHSPMLLPQYHLSVKLSHQQAMDLVLVASPKGLHLRLQKQSMALVVLSLRPVDRLSIVTYSTTAATRVFPLRRMSSQGKQAALQVIDRLCYSAEAEPTEGLRKGVKILKDRVHCNPRVIILHFSDTPTTVGSYVCHDLEFPIPVHRFHIGCEFGMSNGFLMHQFEEFLAELIAGTIREAQVKIGLGEWVRLGELRAGEERRIPVELKSDSEGSESVTVGYSYITGGATECNQQQQQQQRLITNGEIVVGVEENTNNSRSHGSESARDWSSCIDKWEYVDPLIARRWAKHLHGQKT